MLFPLGQIVATPGTLEALERAEPLPQECLDRQVTGEWGDLHDHNTLENAWSLQQGCRSLLAYTTSAGDRIWVLTEADRSAPILLLPHEY